MKDKDWFWIGGLLLIAIFAKDLGKFLFAVAGLAYFCWWAVMLIRISIDPGGNSKDKKGKRVAALIHLAFSATIFLYGLSTLFSR
jgi:hypothetical protein